MKNFKEIIKAGLLVGTLDILAACIQFFINTHKEPSVVFKFIASGVFGTAAFSGGTPMIIAGLAFHYVIALAFTFVFFAIYPKLHSFLRNKILTGIFYGAFIWSIMKFVVLPLSRIPSQPFTYSGAAIAMAILIMCIGIPLALMASKTYPLKKHVN
jgi:hypothetical protein